MDKQTDEDGVTVISFETFDEMKAWMTQNEERANEQVIPEQMEITFGDYVVRMDQPSGVIIFGYIPPLEKQVEDEYDPEDYPGIPKTEAAEAIRGWLVGQSVHYLYGEFYSPLCPDGEFGSAHRVTMWKISKAEFDKAKENNWQVEIVDVARWQGEATEAARKAGMVTQEEVDEINADGRAVREAAFALADGQDPEEVFAKAFQDRKVTTEVEQRAFRDVVGLLSESIIDLRKEEQ